MVHGHEGAAVPAREERHVEERVRKDEEDGHRSGSARNLCCPAADGSAFHQNSTPSTVAEPLRTRMLVMPGSRTESKRRVSAASGNTPSMTGRSRPSRKALLPSE